MAFLLATAVAILFGSALPELPSVALQQLMLLVGALLFLLLIACRSRLMRWQCSLLLVALGVTFGLSWSCHYGTALLQQQLSPELTGSTLLLRGTVTDLPDISAGRALFLFDVDPSFTSSASASAFTSPLPTRVRLSWYGAPVLAPGQRWQLHVRLKPVHGSINPGGFDYQRWLLARGVGATGSVGEVGANILLAKSQGISIDGLRAIIRQSVEQNLTSSVARGLILALLIGDKSQVEASTWALLRETGTTHLMAISGLHITLAAAAGSLLLGGLARCLSLLWPTRIFFPYWSAAGALMVATIYALLAGFSLPTQRAVIMIAVALCYVLSGRQSGRWSGLVLAFAGCLVIDPLAGFDPGFWLSFAAVAALLLVFAFAGGASGWRAYLKAQWAVFVILLVPLLLHGLPLAPAGLLVNLVAIPYVELLVVPLLLLNGLLSLVGCDSHLLWQLSTLLLDGLLIVLSMISGWAVELGGDALVLQGDIPSLLAISLLLVCVLLVVPRLPYREVAAIAFSALLWPLPREPVLFEMTVLDVGQGLAVVVRSGDKTLLYDTGPSWSTYRSLVQYGQRQSIRSDARVNEGVELSAGDMIVLPYLRYKGIRQLDKVIVSHGDSDHQGGVMAIATEMPVTEWLAGDKQRLPASMPGREAVQSCHGRQWHWGEVSFRILTWPLAVGVDGDAKAGESPSVKSNNYSCVLLIGVNGQYVLLPGDIEADFERLYNADLPPVLALTMPHHGSKTSSSAAFLNRLQPVYAIVSSGFLNRYHHPHPTIIDRYWQRDVTVLNTVGEGAITLRLQSDYQWQWVSARDDPRRYWYR